VARSPHVVKSRHIFLLFLLLATVALAQAPIVNPDGVANAADSEKPVTPGSLVAIYGVDLATRTESAAVIPLPRSLAGVTVTFDGIAAPLLFVSAGQINAQLPWEVPFSGTVNMVVNNGVASTSQAVPVEAVNAGIFGILGRAVAVNLDGALAAPVGSIPGFNTHPVSPGDALILYATGLGAVTPQAVTGNDSHDMTRQTVAHPIVLVGGVQAQVLFSGLSPQFVGVNQVNIVVPPNAPGGDRVLVEIVLGDKITLGGYSIAVNQGWPQWGWNAQHTNATPAVGQTPINRLADIVYDPLVPQLQAAASGDLLAHYQVPLVDGNDFYMVFKFGFVDPMNPVFATESWGERKFTWQNGLATLAWSYISDWKPPGSLNDFWEPVFHPALANGALYVPGANGSIVKVDRTAGIAMERISPFGNDPNTYTVSPITADGNGNLFYNAIQVVVGNTQNGGFYANDARDSWLVEVRADGMVSTVSYKVLTSPEAPSPGAQCLAAFRIADLPWPPSPNAVPGVLPCGTQRVGMNVAPAVAPDGTIYSVTRAHFNDRYGFLVAVNPDLTKKWAASFQDRFNDGCGVPVSAGGVMPPDGAPGGCRAGARSGVDPATNRPGAGRVLDSSSSSPLVAPDGSILYGAYSRYNYAQGHLMQFSPNGQFLRAFNFGWDETPAIYTHNGTWSVVIKNNHYGGTGSYCNDDNICPPDRTATNPASPTELFVTQLDQNLIIEWSYKNTNSQSCTRNQNGSVTCVDDHHEGFEWCVNAPLVDGNGVVYAASEDGNLYAINQGGVLKQRIFLQLALGAAYTPASLGSDGKIYTQNAGHLFVVGN
jgi:uncharacterized protein (TIGR03437 family)